MGFEDPRRRQMQATDQPGIVGMKTDRHYIDLEILRPEDDFGTRDRELSELAIAKAAADHNAFGLGPGLGFQKPPRHIGELLCELLDRTMHDGRRFGVVADQDGIEGLLADLVGGLVAERVLAGFLQGFAPPVENLAERAFGGAIPEKAFVVLQFDVEAVDLHGRQTGRAVPGDARRYYQFVGHLPLPRLDDPGTNEREPVWLLCLMLQPGRRRWTAEGRSSGGRLRNFDHIGRLRDCLRISRPPALEAATASSAKPT